ncbi:neprilysin-4-like [Drosophila biarmipes]|uniref:neprilysin-4-like n=1 Tax=Drosophila biarmipes TaxID=125945 RepID=UPI0007E6C5EC|nr:neprilysin-4-like [Drosophila biarmipes]
MNGQPAITACNAFSFLGAEEQIWNNQSGFEIESRHRAMRVLYNICLIGHVLSVCVWGAPTTKEDLNQDTPYITELLRQAKAAEIESFMDQKADPCSDFYTFSCGNYDRINSADDVDEIQTGMFITLAKGYDRKIQEILNTAQDSRDTPEDTQVKHFYQSCMRIKELNSTYIAKMRKLIAEFGTMPVLEGSSWKEEDFDWVGTTARISHRYGVKAIFAAEVLKDLVSNQGNVIVVGEQNFLLASRSLYIDNSTLMYRESIRDNIQEVLRRFLALNVELAKQTAKELVDFEVELAQGMVDDMDIQDIVELSELLTVDEIHKRYAPTLDIKRLVFISMGGPISEPIYEYNKRYQQNLVEVIKRTPKRTLANYIFLRLIWDVIRIPDETPKKQKASCLQSTKEFFFKNLDNLYYRRYNNEKHSIEIYKMWQLLKSTFNDTLRSSSSLDWIERPTRNLAIAKLEAMTFEISNYVGENFTNEFSGLNLQSFDFVENVIQIKVLRARQKREMLHKPATSMDGGEEISSTPVYMQSENAIKLPVMMLQPFYISSHVYPSAVMFGTLAPMIGHELIHGFDESGRSYNAKGDHNDWWDEKSDSNFEKGRECFTKQYGRYVYDGKQLKEATAQSENIADNGGMRLAYTAYRKWYDSQLGKDLAKEIIPNLKYHPNQLFFISFAQSWCNDLAPKYRIMQVASDTHMPGNVRVIGTLANFAPFSKEFNCPAGSPMNPSKKCILY